MASAHAAETKTPHNKLIRMAINGMFFFNIVGTYSGGASGFQARELNGQRNNACRSKENLGPKFVILAAKPYSRAIETVCNTDKPPNRNDPLKSPRDSELLIAAAMPNCCSASFGKR